FNIGGDAYPRVPVESRGYLDTGADVIAVPGEFLVPVVYSIATRGEERYLPDLTFFLKGVDGSEVPLVISPDAYVEPKPKPGHPALLGKYFSFRWSEKKIGIADLE
ncbi:hypothetical protein FOZ60_001111, partial [Perkinsus olseni]